jgi:hypothetical protein
VNEQWWKLDPTHWYNSIDVDIDLLGTESAFPFDSYRQEILFLLEPPEGFIVDISEFEQSELGHIPFQFRILEGFTGYSVRTEALSNQRIIIVVERPLVVRIQTLIIIMALTFLSLWVLCWVYFRPAKNNGRRDDLLALVGLVTLMVAIPAMRFVLVPSEIHSPTTFDYMLLLPLLFSLTAIFFAIFRSYIVHRPAKPNHKPHSGNVPFV